jgi:hypothetical protein
MSPRFLTLVAVAGILPALGCDFFRELDSEESAGTSTGTGGSGSSGGSGSGGGPCTVVDDDRCGDQDTLESCNEEDGVVTTYDCGLECGVYTNFTCIRAASGQHSCWCTGPGQQKVYSCTELEACLSGCGWDDTTGCADQCFARTTASTVRMYGAVVHCAFAACEPLCASDPASCDPCIQAALAGQAAGCALERSVCNADTNDEWGP